MCIYYRLYIGSIRRPNSNKGYRDMFEEKVFISAYYLYEFWYAIILVESSSCDK